MSLDISVVLHNLDPGNYTRMKRGNPKTTPNTEMIFFADTICINLKKNDKRYLRLFSMI
jgi:hypothetical protein